MKTLKHFINGQYVAGRSEDTFELVSPVDGETYALSPNANAEEVEQAYSAAEAAFIIWRKSTPAQRQKALLQLADEIERNVERLVNAQSQETGQLRHFIEKEEIAASCDAIRFFAGAARCLEGKAAGEYSAGFTSTIRREPLGIVGQVTPWNYPFMMAVWKIAPALAAGNTVVLKPSDTTPVSTLLLAELAAPLFPRGAFNVVLGKASTGSLVVSNPKASLVSITGSVRAGLQVAASAAANLTKAHLELGGKAPAVVFADADMDKAIATITTAGFFNAGQDCTAATRILVEQSIYAEFLEKLVQKTKSIKFGAPADQAALYGALNSKNQLEQVKGFIARLPAHAKIETGGRTGPGPGFYFEPTIVSGLHQNDEAIQHEVFGPVMTIQSFSTDEEGLHKANDVEYGLAASVWTSNHGRAQRFSIDLDFGTVWINNHIPLCAEMPHGGFKKSGYGKDLSSYSLEEYTRVKHIMCDISE
ncbi:TPA: aminobutyraldehyde dehydrogenase [Citrobacter braakii]|uniref:Gamma-aminobutyraldehyde dehydrogenase n=1 Tax=Citrobacter braakii TaxID=57706 RepID=A0A1V8P5E4_CITBR|nr:MULTISPECIES: aminobutyraldehyde dehydrogenase [Citrobacter]MEB0940029.1 aminobutyraldehyde dehydrogenase [Citrobacter braakii]MEB0945118.1 aminobutyraldehyde dehydrogenase [Citrobacter braakii]MEB0969924.1 aminobutyraldehyde dehydrogenase [Citrobacter braakii]MEB0994445.1 aminobutyraldehyde dehydrogenase [Citrobacter braakii]MEB1009839.1 aminobutyraldehyde dehydrogenase [Citrobacter braakii]